MAITVSMAGKIAALDALLDLIDGGSGDATGDFVVKNASGTALGTMTFSATAFAGATDGSTVATADSNTITGSSTPTPDDIASGAFRNKANTEVIAFAISESGGGGDMIVTSVTIPSDATSVTCDGVTVTLDID